MNKPLKVKETQSYKDSTGAKIVHKGILKRIEVLSSGQTCPLGLTDSDEYTYKYIVISETENIEENDWVHNSYSGGMYLVTPTSLNYARHYLNTQIVFKIIVLPKQFSPETLQAIEDKIYNDGDEVFVECEYINMFKTSGLGYYQINLTKNHANIIPINKNDSLTEKGLKILKEELEKSDVRKYTCINGFGYSPLERNIVERILALK